MQGRESSGELVMGGLFRILADVRVAGREERLLLGSAGVCRFCGVAERNAFRKKAHAIPEALGNKWIFSQDECDSCNARFGALEAELCNAVSPLLTVGGVKGKGNEVRQTGRSRGTHIRHSVNDGKRRIAIRVVGEPPEDVLAGALGGSKAALRFPVPAVPFRPQSAFKALVKVGFAFLPTEVLGEFTRLGAWLLDKGGPPTRGALGVGLSFSWIGNAPPMASGTILRRVPPDAVWPDALFIVTIGSICAQLELVSDRAWDRQAEPTRVDIEWTNVWRAESGEVLERFHFGRPTRFDWSSPELQPQPIAAFKLLFSSVTARGELVPILRDSDGRAGPDP